MLLQAKSSAIYTNQLIFFHQKINGISQSDAGLNMFLNDGFVTERCVILRQALVLFQQASKQFSGGTAPKVVTAMKLP
ncbi:Uncharacterised protein [Serratia grimesii]|nr:Uncharacterised protein [Serratia grimesii]SMZ54918.1 Uncharacterised protein [Serratia grimesii]